MYRISAVILSVLIAFITSAGADADLQRSATPHPESMIDLPSLSKLAVMKGGCREEYAERRVAMLPKRRANLPSLEQWSNKQEKVEVIVLVRKYAFVKEPSVTLGDVAMFLGGDEQTRQKMAKIPLCKSPVAGRSKRLTKGMIEIALARGNVTDHVKRLSMPLNSSVERESQTIIGEELKKVARKTILESFSNNKEAVILKNWKLPAEVILPTGNVSLSVELKHSRQGKAVGTRMFTIKAVVDNRFEKQISGSVHVDRIVHVVRALIPLERGRIIQKHDVELTRVTQTNMTQKAMRNLELVIGKVCSRSINGGAVVRSDSIAEALLIRANQTILAQVVNRNMRLQTKCIAQQNGGLGDVIKIVNPTSGRQALARITGPQRVNVIF